MNSTDKDNTPQWKHPFVKNYMFPIYLMLSISYAVNFFQNYEILSLWHFFRAIIIIIFFPFLFALFSFFLVTAIVFFLILIFIWIAGYTYSLEEDPLRKKFDEFHREFIFRYLFALIAVCFSLLFLNGGTWSDISYILEMLF